MTKTLLQKIALILVFALPVLFVLGGLALVILPAKTPPEYDFVYATNYQKYNSKTILEIKAGNLVEAENTQSDCNGESNPDLGKYSSSGVQPKILQCNNQSNQYKLYKHSPKSNTSAPLTIPEAQKYQYTNSTTSPDGFLFQEYVVIQYNPINLSNHNNQDQRNSLVKGASIIPQSLADQQTGNGQIHFVGWVKNK